MCNKIEQVIDVLLKKLGQSLIPDENGDFPISNTSLKKQKKYILYLIQMHYAQTKRYNENRKELGIAERLDHLPANITETVQNIPLLVEL